MRAIHQGAIVHEAITNRPMSGFPVSVATGLSLESLFTPIQPVIDETRQVENLPDLSIYNLYIFNTSTLLRNLINSLPAKELLLISKKEIYDTLLEEIEFLTNFFTSNNLHVKFYTHSYKYVKDVYKDKLRKVTTDKQLLIDSINSYCLDRLRKEDDVTLFHKNISYNKEDRALLFTHVPFDLISYSNFTKLDLLESHTGKIKSRKDWWSKYYPLPSDKDMSFLPFMEYLLSVFGDHVMFTPAPLKERIALYEAMQKKPGINPLMSELSLSFMRN